MTTDDRADPAQLKSLQILFEDDLLLAVSKPPGMSVHGGAGGGRTALELLEAAYPARRKLFLVHRIDKATSGVLLVAKSSEMAKRASAVWDRYTKRYLAVALGRVEGERTIDRPLADDDGKPQSARTVIRALAALGRLEPKGTLLAATIETGRMHQNPPAPRARRTSRSDGRQARRLRRQQALEPGRSRGRRRPAEAPHAPRPAAGRTAPGDG